MDPCGGNLPGMKTNRFVCPSNVAVVVDVSFLRFVGSFGLVCVSECERCGIFGFFSIILSTMTHIQ